MNRGISLSHERQYRPRGKRELCDPETSGEKPADHCTHDDWSTTHRDPQRDRRSLAAIGEFRVSIDTVGKIARGSSPRTSSATSARSSSSRTTRLGSCSSPTRDSFRTRYWRPSRQRLEAEKQQASALLDAAELHARDIESAGMTLHPLDPQTRMEALASIGDVSDELHERLAEGSLLLRGESVPIAPERREDFTSRHRAASSARPGPPGTPHRCRRT